MNLIKQRWLTVAGRYYGRHAKKILGTGILYVTRESIEDARNRPSDSNLSLTDKWAILATLSDIGIVGPLQATRPIPKPQRKRIKYHRAQI